jgi:hypothetical protein
MTMTHHAHLVRCALRAGVPLCATETASTGYTCQRLPDTHHAPDGKVKPDDYTVLMAADGRNPEGLHAWISDHRRMQVKDRPLGGRTTWDVEVEAGGDYRLRSDSPPLALGFRPFAVKGFGYT